MLTNTANVTSTPLNFHTPLAIRIGIYQMSVLFTPQQHPPPPVLAPPRLRPQQLQHGITLIYLKLIVLHHTHVDLESRAMMTPFC